MQAWHKAPGMEHIVMMFSVIVTMNIRLARLVKGDLRPQEEGDCRSALQRKHSFPDRPSAYISDDRFPRLQYPKGTCRPNTRTSHGMSSSPSTYSGHASRKALCSVYIHRMKLTETFAYTVARRSILGLCTTLLSRRRSAPWSPPTSGTCVRPHRMV